MAATFRSNKSVRRPCEGYWYFIMLVAEVIIARVRWSFRMWAIQKINWLLN